MGQHEILGFLVRQAKDDPKAWFTSEEIYVGLKEDGHHYERSNVRRCLFPLVSHKYLDTELVRGKGFSTKRLYRASERALKELGNNG